MFERIMSNKAKEIVRPWYEDGIKRLLDYVFEKKQKVQVCLSGRRVRNIKPKKYSIKHQISNPVNLFI